VLSGLADRQCVSLTFYLVHFRLNATSWANVPALLGTEINIHNHFLSVRLFDEKSRAVNVSYFTRDGVDALPYFWIALQEIWLTAFSISTGVTS
jgi:hypothetical protein